MSFNKWTSIEGFHNVRKAVNKYDLHTGSITYRGKIKLHGTNAGIVIKPNGDVFAQSRSSIIGTGNDNAGFAAWVESTKDIWSEACARPQFTIYGEWCGKGIQKGVAITQIDSKQFAIFSIQIGDCDEDGNAEMIIDPTEIDNFLFARFIELPYNAHILPWYGDEISVDYANTSSLEIAAGRMNEAVEVVEACDPWVKEVFHIEGTGEGIVYYPISFETHGIINRQKLSTFMFKAKGEKHKVVKTKRAVEIDPVVVASVDEFVALVVTDARLEQGAMEVNRGKLEFTPKLIGPFIGWFSKDVSKECADELEESGLEWKQVSKAVSNTARDWYLKKIEEI